MTDVYVDQHIATDQISWPTMAHNTFKLGNMAKIIFLIYLILGYTFNAKPLLDNVIF